MVVSYCCCGRWWLWPGVLEAGGCEVICRGGIGAFQVEALLPVSESCIFDHLNGEGVHLLAVHCEIMDLRAVCAAPRSHHSLPADAKPASRGSAGTHDYV